MTTKHDITRSESTFFGKRRNESPSNVFPKLETECRKFRLPLDSSYLEFIPPKLCVRGEESLSFRRDHIRTNKNSVSWTQSQETNTTL